MTTKKPVKEVSQKAKKTAKQTKKPTAQTTEPVAERQPETQFEVGKVGWENENIIPIVLVDKKTRARLGVDTGSMVKVSKASSKVVAVVNLQFWEFVGTGKCTLSTKLAEALDAKVGDSVKIEAGVTESEAQQFIAQHNPIARMMNHIASRMRQE